MDAWARVRPRERDGDSGHTEEQEVAGKERVATERERESGGGARSERGLDGLDSPARRY